MGAYTGKYSRFMFNERNRYIHPLAQQGIAMVDADINESYSAFLYQLRRAAQILGDGSPNNGFKIEAIPTANDFTIKGGTGTPGAESEGDVAGRFFLKGIGCVLFQDVNYNNLGATQDQLSIFPQITAVSEGGGDTTITDSSANYEAGSLVNRTIVPDVANPSGPYTITANTATTITVNGTSLGMIAGTYYRINLDYSGPGTRRDGVYLNVFFDEIDRYEDPNLIHRLSVATIGQLRSQLRQVINVVQDIDTYLEPADYTDSDGNYHYIFKLAEIARQATIIYESQILDLRPLYHDGNPFNFQRGLVALWEEIIAARGGGLAAVTGEPIGIGATNYTGTLSKTNIVPGSVIFDDPTTPQQLADNGGGLMLGDGYGTINYDTGAYDVTFTVATGAVTADFSYMTNGAVAEVVREYMAPAGGSSYSGYLKNLVIVPFSVVIQPEDGSQVITDNGTGGLTGGIGLGTIDYNTGYYSFTFTLPTVPGQNIVADYDFSESLDARLSVSLNDDGTLKDVVERHHLLMLKPIPSFPDPNNKITVKSGRYVSSNGKRVLDIVSDTIVPSGSSSFSPVGLGLERYDLVAATDTETIAVIPGTPVAFGTGTPRLNAPDIPVSMLAIAIVKVTEQGGIDPVIVEEADITDVREFLNKGGGTGGDGGDFPGEPVIYDLQTINTEGQTIVPLGNSSDLVDCYITYNSLIHIGGVVPTCANPTPPPASYEYIQDLAHLRVYVNGVLQTGGPVGGCATPGTDYEETTISSITFCPASIPVDGDALLLQIIVQGDQYAYVMGNHSLFVYRNGQLQLEGVDYIELTVNSVEFLAPLHVGERVLFVVYSVASETVIPARQDIDADPTDTAQDYDYGFGGGTEHCVAFTITQFSFTPDYRSVLVYSGGILQRPIEDYTELPGQIIFTTPRSPGEVQSFIRVGVRDDLGVSRTPAVYYKLDIAPEWFLKDVDAQKVIQLPDTGPTGAYFDSDGSLLVFRNGKMLMWGRDTIPPTVGDDEAIAASDYRDYAILDRHTIQLNFTPELWDQFLLFVPNGGRSGGVNELARLSDVSTNQSNAFFWAGNLAAPIDWDGSYLPRFQNPLATMAMLIGSRGATQPPDGYPIGWVWIDTSVNPAAIYVKTADGVPDVYTLKV